MIDIAIFLKIARIQQSESGNAKRLEKLFPANKPSYLPPHTTTQL